MERPDWNIHCVGYENAPEPINAHTHGMENYNHLDFQLVLPYTPEDIMYMLNVMGQRVREGERFSAGDMVSGLYDDCKVRLDLVTETGREVLRLIVPDRNGRFPEDPECEPEYDFQTQTMFE